ncbi:MAG: hypothetical protein WCL48_09225 [Betaproteobacteria bacterium]
MEQKTRDYFSFFLGIYFFGLSLYVQSVVLPSNGRPTALHLILSLTFCVLGLLFFLRGFRHVIYVWGKPG